MSKLIIPAFDGLTLEQAIALGKQIGDRCYAVKVHDMHDRYGPKLIRILKKYFARVWVDYKLHDTPDTVYKRALVLKNSGADIVTVHASGDGEMIAAAVRTGIKVFAVTVLTSLKPEQVEKIYGKGKSAKEVVLELGKVGIDAGADGVVCSALEVSSFQEFEIFKGWEFVIPGTRSLGVDANDQKRTDTPRQAVLNGATRLVIGRQVTSAANPLSAFDSLEKEIVI